MTKCAKQTGDPIRSDRMARIRNLGRDIAVAYLRLSRKLSVSYHSQCQLDVGSDLEAEPGTSSFNLACNIRVNYGKDGES